MNAAGDSAVLTIIPMEHNADLSLMKIPTIAKVLWAISLVVLAGYQGVAYVPLTRQHAQFFQSTREMLLVAALATVALVGVLVKSYQNRG